MRVVTKRRPSWRLVSGLFPAGVAVAVPILLALFVTEDAPEAFVFAAVCLAMLPLLIAQQTEQVGIDDTAITVTRPPLSRRHIPVAAVTRVEKFSPDRWFVHTAGRGRPVSLILNSLDNREEVCTAVVELATRNGIPVEEHPIHRELTDEGQ
ncbi:MAG TPA: hypothetical protein VM942_07520 [Acidimicrobiales bacterium]|nr:hypothetical protein [Acidimicrobiales bacterium]